MVDGKYCGFFWMPKGFYSEFARLAEKESFSHLKAPFYGTTP
jgi:hypothetical protein